jgi:hypothetical protein
VGDSVDVGIGHADVREANDDVESPQRAYVAVQMRKALLGDALKSCGIGRREPLQIGQLVAARRW